MLREWRYEYNECRYRRTSDRTEKNRPGPKDQAGQPNVMDASGNGCVRFNIRSDWERPAQPWRCQLFIGLTEINGSWWTAVGVKPTWTNYIWDWTEQLAPARNVPTFDKIKRVNQKLAVTQDLKNTCPIINRGLALRLLPKHATACNWCMSVIFLFKLQQR